MINRDTWAVCIDALGIPAEFHQTKAPSAVVNIAKVGISTANSEDSQLIEAIGFGGRVITIKAADLGGLVPVKFDIIKIASRTLVIDTVHEVLEPVSGAVMGYKAYVKGVNR
jgi:hypothetical protein